MEKPQFGRRRTDKYKIADSPQKEEDNSSDTFAQIVRAGLQLQKAVSEGAPIALELAEKLTEHADLNSNAYEDYEDSPRERLAAAFFLWPFHSARYYGYTAVSDEQRLASRTALCLIQALLYNNIRGILDLSRVWFNTSSDEETRKFVAAKERRLWRPAKLLDYVPDLCAIDLLITHMLDMMKARPLVRRAIESIQKLSLSSQKPEADSKVCAAVSEAFRKLNVAQMTVFYNPKPVEVEDRDEIPLYELVHETSDTDPTPSKLIPFEDDGLLAKNFRRLAHTIYSVRDKKEFPHFSTHRYSTIERISETTSFISDGRITSYFLSTKPPLEIFISGNGNSNSDAEAAQRQRLWPFWFRPELSEVDFDDDPPDWSNQFWWKPIGSDELKRSLFPGLAELGLHQNDHMSAYWDDLVSTNQKFVNQIDIPDEHPTGEPSFGFLMELLLRREPKTRTSFFFALAQTYGKRSRLCQFVGGTFLGLEYPGVPFCQERFEAIGARVRGLVMAVSHFTTAQAIKQTRWQTEQERSDFDKRVKLVLSLLRGNNDERRFARDGDLLFAKQLRDGKTDHNYIPSESLGWKPSRFQIKSVFVAANHLNEKPKTSQMISGSCDNTWKALFYLGGQANTHYRLNRIVPHLREQRDSRPGAVTVDLADRSFTCEHCFRAALEFLLSRDIYEALCDKIEISRKSITLPSRPGIRFLIALCRFIVDVQSQLSPENTRIKRIEFAPNSVIMDFDKPKLLRILWGRKDFAPPNVGHTVGIFKMLEACLVFQKSRRMKLITWEGFLNSAEFARRLTVEKDGKERRLTLRW